MSVALAVAAVWIVVIPVLVTLTAWVCTLGRARHARISAQWTAETRPAEPLQVARQAPRRRRGCALLAARGRSSRATS